jgi:hypothetical protein
MIMSSSEYGSSGGVELTDELIERIAGEAEEGYDVERLRPRSRRVVDQLREDVAVLAQVGRMYLDALDADPANEYLTLPEALMVTAVREAVERQEKATWATT